MIKGESSILWLHHVLQLYVFSNRGQTRAAALSLLEQKEPLRVFFHITEFCSLDQFK